jgi:hypothetical protein
VVLAVSVLLPVGCPVEVTVPSLGVTEASADSVSVDSASHALNTNSNAMNHRCRPTSE